MHEANFDRLSVATAAPPEGAAVDLVNQGGVGDQLTADQHDRMIAPSSRALPPAGSGVSRPAALDRAAPRTSTLLVGAEVRHGRFWTATEAIAARGRRARSWVDGFSGVASSEVDSACPG